MSYEDMLEEAQDEIPDDLGSTERFEMPEVETRRDGSKTVLENFSQYVEAFNRDEKHLSDFLLNELGTAGHVEDGELMLNGEFRRGQIRSRIEAYAEKYLYCSECGKPDTELETEKGVEIMKCQACGARNPIQ
jgi:translation initiation factor 2 subunit 2